MKIIKILLKAVVSVIIGIFGLYLFLALAVIPVAVPWAAQSQGKKLLAHEVFLGGARFNPFTLQFSLRDFRILDADKKPMVGFRRFWVDVSLLRLLKKQIYVESIGFDGLALNVVLLPGNQVNLLSLVPEQAQAPAQTPAQTPAQPQAPAQPQVPSGTLPSAGSGLCRR